jgi:hypothetical protein
MKRAFLLAIALSVLAGSWQVTMAQASTPAKSKKTATAAQSVTPAPTETAAVEAAVADTEQPADPAPADSTPHKKKGLFGKAKSVMSNKIVKTVAKTAACTMVPGGQAIAGAIDAASSQSAGEAASGAASAATGTACMPGLGGAGMGAGMAGAGMAGAQMAPTGGAYPQGMPTGYGMGIDPKPMADCMGLTMEEYNAMTNPTAGEPRGPTKAEMKRQQQLAKKVGNQRLMACQQQVTMQQAQAGQAHAQQMMAMAQARGGMTNMAMPAPDGGDATMTEAPGQQVALSDDLAAELKKGKTVVRGIDWVAGSADVSPAGRAGFEVAMTTLGQAIKESGQHYRLDLYVDQKYDDAAVGMFAASRLQAIQVALGTAIGNPAAVPAAGKTKRDKNPRLEVVKAK